MKFTMHLKKPEAFATLKKYLEGHPVRHEDREAHPSFNFNRRPDKRLDHRHHLIDAITLALTSRSLFQQMARNYKTETEKMLPRDGENTEQRERRLNHETRLRLNAPEPPLRNVRAAALEAVRVCKISIKPDRYPDGALFKDTAYGISQREGEDRLRLTLRQTVAELGKQRGKTSVESARKAIATIVSTDVQRIINGAFEDRISNGMDASTALALPVRHPLYDKPIRKVRCFEGYADDAQRIVFTSRLGEHCKYLVNSGYAYLELTSDGSKPPRLVKTIDAMRDKGKPTPQGVVRVYKRDIITDSKDEKPYPIGYFTAEGNIFVIPIFDPRSFDKITEAGAAILVTDARHLPCALQVPLATSGMDAGRLRQQIGMDSSEKRGQLWQQLVAVKLGNQAYALRQLQRKGTLRLERLATQVKHGDQSNAEGQGAKHYWGNLFPNTFQRSKQGAEDPLNMRFNYSYAVLRAMIARTLVASGLNGTLGLGHCNAGNAFNLADDFIEPYRFLVDGHLAQTVETWDETPLFDSCEKKHLLTFVTRPVRIAKQDMRLHTAISTSIASYVCILEGKDHPLLLPEGLAENPSWESMAGA